MYTGTATTMTRQVVLICGPPCSGKSTFARTHAGPGDVVVDYDEIAQNFGSRRAWNHRPIVKKRVDQVVLYRMGEIANSRDVRAWVIRTLPIGYERGELARWLRADRVVLLLPPRDVLLARADERPQPQRTRHAIGLWFARYSPHPRDELVTEEGGRQL